MKRVFAVLELFGALVVPALAHAGTVTEASGTLSFVAASGETNAVEVVRVLSLHGFIYRIRDTGAPLTAQSPCAQVNANEANCPVSGITLIRTTLGDGNDT